MESIDWKRDLFKVVPVEPFNIAHFDNFYPMNPRNPREKLQGRNTYIPHPVDWKDCEEHYWPVLKVGTALFRLYTGPQNDGWRHGYYLVHKK